MNRIEAAGGAAIFKGTDPRRTRELEGDYSEWLTGVLERGERGRDGKVEKRPHLYGSDAGFCARRNTLLAHNVWLENTVNSAGRGYMAIGVAFEDLLVQALKRERRFLVGQLKGVELGGIKISSRYDAIVLDERDEIALLEVKTCGDLPTEEKPAHLAQLQTYAAISGIRNAHLVYLSRNLHPLKPIAIRTFRVDTSDEALLKRLQIAEESQAAIRERKLPPTPATFRKHTECHYCEFRDHFCWGTRPGRGGDPEQPPIPELTPEAYIRLAAAARGRAEAHLNGIEGRYLQTLELILDQCQVTLFPEQKTLLAAERLRVQGRLAGAVL